MLVVMVSCTDGDDTVSHVSASSTTSASGRFLLRIDPELHRRLRREADAQGRSLNEHCARRLAEPATALSGVEGATSTLRRALEMFGDALVGVVVFGSWARGTTHAGSDVDLLLVLGPDEAPARAMYRSWDREPSTWDGRRVEAHLVRLTGNLEAPTALWAEIAQEGIVVWERDFRLSRRLAVLRKQLAGSGVQRRTLHGQPYWTEDVADAQS